MLRNALLIGTLWVSVGLAQKTVTLEDFDRNELKSETFSLNKTQSVEIEAVGPRIRDEEDSFAWILNLKTRQAVWLVGDADDDRGPNRRTRIFTDRVELPAGEYEVFYYTGNRFYQFNGRFRVADLFDRDFYDNEFRRSELRSFKLTLKGNLNTVSNKDRHLSNIFKNRIVNLSKMEGDVYERIGLRVTSDTQINIYAVGEVTRDGLYDAAWITNTKTGKRIWEMDRFETEPAGGGDKNRSFKGSVDLEKGDYLLTVVSDDSHHYDDWNVIPPYDPEGWGVQVFSPDGQVERYNYKKEAMKNQIVDLTGLGDDEYVSKGFTLKKALKVRVKAIGEGTGRDLADYGWIVNADTRKKVWEMRYYDTEHAGGARKNRLADETITLKKGSYLVYFVTDDSHSYGDRFNASRPYDPEEWGISLYAVEDDFDTSLVTEYKAKEPKNVLVKLTRMRDDEAESARFSLSEDSDVRVYAIGEGSGGRMYDYAYIREQESGRRVWVMEYDDTDHAGGARKNRMVDTTIRLKKGEYKVYFRTDGSHSFRNWNSTPPFDQEFWGVTLYKLDE